VPRQIFEHNKYKKKIVQIQSETAAQKNKIIAEGEASATLLRAQAESDAQKTFAKVKAENQMIEAEASSSTKMFAATSAANAKRLEAESNADAKRAEGKARGEAADFMDSDFAQEYALRELQVIALGTLKINHLNVLTSGGGGGGKGKPASGSESWLDNLIPNSVAQQVVQGDNPTPPASLFSIVKAKK